MNQLLKKLPIPIASLMLGIASLGSLMKAYSLTYLANFFGLLAGLIALLLLLKLLIFPKITLEHFKQPIIASIAPTFSMGMMILSTYLLDYTRIGAYFLWGFSIVLHYFFMSYFIYFFIIKKRPFQLEKVLPSWLIVFVGIGVIAVTSPPFSIPFGQFHFWLGLLLASLILPLVTYRVFKGNKMPDATMPLMTIIAAPISLELTAYLSVFKETNGVFIFSLMLVSQLIYFIVLIRVFPYLFSTFYPSFSAFTFPLVITATSLTLVSRSLSDKLPLGISTGLTVIAKTEVFIACFVVLIVLIRYLNFLFSSSLKGE